MINNKIIYILLFSLLGLLSTTLVATDCIPPFMYTSIFIAALIIYVFAMYGVFSPATLVTMATFFPSLSFFWARLNGATYINYHDHWLQRDILLVNKAVFLSLVTFFFSIAVMPLYNKVSLEKIKIQAPLPPLQPTTFLLISFAAGCFFWLTEPTFNTILQSSYSDILEQRFSGTQFAGGMALLLWIFAFQTYCSTFRKRNDTHFRGRYIWPNKFFIAVTVFGTAWFALHARRSELLGILFLIIVFLSEIKGKKKAIVLAVSSLLLFIVIEQVRHLSLSFFFSDSSFSSSNLRSSVGIVSLPGGASNVFQTFLTTLHYFSTHTFFYGETFYNYIYQCFPSFLYNWFGIERPEYYSQIILGRYSYNGGTYLPAVFYANFSLFGPFFAGLFIGLYIRIINRSLMSKYYFIKVMGFYLIAIAFRAIWYELIVVIKPILFVILPCHITSIIIKSNINKVR